MTVSIEAKPHSIIYALLLGAVYVNKVTEKEHKEWQLNLFSTEAERKRRVKRCAKEMPGCDLMLLEIGTDELFDKAELITEIPKTQRN